MDKASFLNFCKNSGYKQQDLNYFEKAFEFAESVLKDKKRLSGDTILEHNIRVAIILVENKSAPEIVVTGILHGLLKYEIEKEIKEKFPEEIVRLLKGVDQIEEIKSRNKKIEAEALRKILLTTLQDVRVIFIKLANKLDNLNSIDILPESEQKRIAEEVLEIYAPFAYRLGAEKIRTKLEDRAFRIINPRKYREIANFLEESRQEREESIKQAVNLIKQISKDKVNINYIKGRPKHIYSIYKKIKEKKIALHKLFDLLGIRVIVQKEKDCYTLLGLLHETFESIENRLKDYIANPKPNFYRSIHTAIKLPHGKIAEIQIRTPEMDEFAEEGLAAHWQYKGIKSEQKFEKKVAWLKGILDLQKSSESKEFLETVKVDLFGDKIYCYTPKGDVKELPLRATLLDFAFLVHEEVGSKCVGGRVNGKFVPISHKLSAGDVVEVLTNKKQRPRRGWIKIVTSAKARQKIRKSLKTHEKLPALYFRKLKPLVKEERGILVHSEEFPKAECILAKCCQAIPGDSVVGIITKRKIISVHREDCKAALKEQNRWVPVHWKKTFNQKIKFFVEAKERSGLLADLLHTIATAGFEVKEAKAILVGADHARCSFLVIPKDLDHLKELIKRVKKVKSVYRIYFE